LRIGLDQVTRAREKRVIELIDDDLCPRVGLRPRLRRRFIRKNGPVLIDDKQILIRRLANTRCTPAQSRLAQMRERHREIKSGLDFEARSLQHGTIALACAVLVVARIVVIDDPLRNLRVRRQVIAEAVEQRLAKLRVETLHVVAKTQIVTPFETRRRNPRPSMPDVDLKAASAAEVRRQAETEQQIVRPPRPLHCIHAQTIHAVVVDEIVRYLREVARGLKPRESLVDETRIVVVACLDFEIPLHIRLRHASDAVYNDLVDTRLLACGSPTMSSDIRGIRFG
jgi:hypothetical protein